MTSLALVIAIVLVVTGAVAAAGTAVTRARAVGAVACGALVLIILDGQALTAGPTAQSLATASVPLAVALGGTVVLGSRRATSSALAAAVVAGPVRQLVDDPFHDPACVGLCDPNPLAVAPHPALADAALVVGGVLLVAALLVAAMLSPARHRGVRTLTGAGLAGLTAWSLATGSAVGAVLAATTGAVQLAVELARAATRSSRLAEGVAALASAQDPEHVLGRAFGSRAISLGYPVGDGRVVDRSGRTMGPPGPGLMVVEISGPLGVVAQVRGELDGMGPVALTQALRGPARLALENNRLAAEAGVRAVELTESAQRLVARAEQSRRSIERDMHDGAQRHVLNLGIAIQADRALPEPVKKHAAVVVRLVLDQLREAAHGISPPQLGTGGLAHALAGLADRSTVPLDAAFVPKDVDEDVAHAAYRLVEETLRSATGPVAITLTQANGGWRVVVVADAAGDLPQSSSDRFLALGGSLGSVRVGPGWRHEARLPRRLP